MTTWRRWFIDRSSAAIFCLPSIWWTRAIRMPGCWSRVDRNMASRSSVPSRRIQAGSRASSACKLGNTMRHCSRCESDRSRPSSAWHTLLAPVIESTHAQAVKRSGLRRTIPRSVQNHLQHVIPAAAINLLRIAARTAGTPLAKTRRSHFAALQFHAACIRHQYQCWIYPLLDGGDEG